MRCVIEPLTFALLDDICLALQSGAIELSDLPSTQALDLGPIIEWAHVSGLASGQDSPWLDAERFSELLARRSQEDKWFHPDQSAQGFVSIRAIKKCETNWTDYAMRAKRAAVSAGFTADEGAKLVAAIGEFRSNIAEHSQHEDTGYLAFDASPGRFEFVVADAGIGVLNSLRSHPHFASLEDAGTALELALSEGVSRHYDEKGRGLGFRPLFIGLANISRFMRFRSGDHSREVSRANNGSITSSTHQKSLLNGFFCSVLCEKAPILRKA